MTAVPIRYVYATLCQVARSPNAGAWVTVPYLEFMGGGEGAGQFVGSATFRQHSGVRTAINQGTMQQVGELPGVGNPLGMLVRALVQDDSGSVAIGGDNWEPCFHGEITTRAVLPQGKTTSTNGALFECQAVGIVAVLDRLVVTDGRMVAGAGSQIINPGGCPKLNSTAAGDRSASTYSVNGQAVYVSDVTAENTGNKWTARQALEYLFACAATPVDGSGNAAGWNWYLSDPDSCLNYEIPELDPEGQSLFAILMQLAGPRRGLSMYARVNDGNVTLIIHPTVATAITVGSFTLPATSKTKSFDVRGDAFMEQPQIAYDDAGTYDVIEVVGAHPIVTLTIGKENLEAGWTNAQETDHATNPDDPKNANVYRRFIIKNTWNGKQNGTTTGLRDLLNLANNAQYGENGYTGARFFGDEGFATPANYLSADSTLVTGTGFTNKRLGARDNPVVVAELQTGLWTDLIGTLKYGISVETSPPAIILEDSKYGLDLKGIWTNCDMRVTIAIREAAPLRVSWRRPSSEWPRSTPRVKRVDLSGCEQWLALSGCVTGVNDSDALTTLGSDITVRDDLPAMRGTLALLRAWLGDASVSGQITNRAIVDTSTATRPGTLITTIVTGNPTHTLNTIITSRTYVRVVRDNVPMWDTVYQYQTALPELDAVL